MNAKLIAKAADSIGTARMMALQTKTTIIVWGYSSINVDGKIFSKSFDGKKNTIGIRHMPDGSWRVNRIAVDKDFHDIIFVAESTRRGWNFEIKYATPGVQYATAEKPNAECTSMEQALLITIPVPSPEPTV